MSIRGIPQLRRLTLIFCDLGGSSKGARMFIDSHNLKQFKEQNPQIEFEFLLRRNRHPTLKALYVNNYVKEQPLRNESYKDILDHYQKFRQSIGRKKLTHQGKNVYGVIQSVQGQWRPNMFDFYPKAALIQPQKEMSIIMPQVIKVLDPDVENKKMKNKSITKEIYRKYRDKAHNYDHEGYNFE